MARRKKGRPISGILLLDKPQGLSSNSAVQKVKRLFKAQKAGHTGTLDPMATGVLPICLGEATKFSRYLLDADKAYSATMQIGEKTDTCDAEGEVVERIEACATVERCEQAIAHMQGEYWQTPPMYSALKKDGQPLYKLARQGVEVQREPRFVNIASLALDSFDEQSQQLSFSATCSKGTYIRVLAEDIAKQFNQVAHLIMLRRTLTAGFSIDSCYSIEQLEALVGGDEDFASLDALLLDSEIAVEHLPLVEVSIESGYDVRRGQAVFAPQALSLIDQTQEKQWVRLKQTDNVFLGMGEVLDDGFVQPRRLIAENH